MSTLKPVSKGVMHCGVAAPQRSFWTRYLPAPTEADPNWAPIWFEAGGVGGVGAAAVVVVPGTTGAVVVVVGVGFGGVAAEETALPIITVPSVTATASTAASR